MIRLRRLLLGKDYERLVAMREEVERVLVFEEQMRHRTRQTDLVAGVLSEAMLLRENQDRGISRALRPAISDAIKAAVRDDPQPVVEAVSPVIGPAIRRAVSDAITGMLELLDKLLEHNFSWRALQWRVEAWRSGRHYSEIVLLRTLIYRVDQALLIHRKTGLLLQHAQSPQAGVKDPDLVGGMLTAITDFVSDSFSVVDEAPVQTMHVGDCKVIVEQGRLAILAAIVRGNPPSELAGIIRGNLEAIELLYREKLEHFAGDATPFAEAHGLLEECLKSQQRPATGRRPWLAPALVALLLLAPLAYWGFSSYNTHRLWTRALAALRAEPGLVVTDSARHGDVYRVSGLRDLLSREPEEVIGPAALSALKWEWDWRGFLSAEADFTLARARQALQPPPTVALSLDGGVLRLSGEAAKQWVDAMHSVALRIPGITGYRDDTLEVIDDAAKRRETLRRYRQDIEDTVLYFDVDAMRLTQEQSSRLDALAAATQALPSVAAELGLTTRYLVTGYADATGSPARNRLLSFSRASSVIEELVARGVSERLFLPLRMGVSMPKTAGAGTENRRVTLEVMLLEDGAGVATR